MEKEVRIKLNKEQTLKFLSYFVDDAVRIANERKRQVLKEQDEDAIAEMHLSEVAAIE